MCSFPTLPLLTPWHHAGIIQVANKLAQRLLGYKKAEMEGKNVSMLMPPPFSHRHNGYLRTHVSTGGSALIRLCLRGPLVLRFGLMCRVRVSVPVDVRFVIQVLIIFHRRHPCCWWRWPQSFDAPVNANTSTHAAPPQARSASWTACARWWPSTRSSLCSPSSWQ